MDPIIGGLIAGGASLLGNVFSANTSAANTQAQIGAQENMLQQTEGFNNSEMMQAEAFANSQAGVQRQYETQMSNTAYQRAAADMKAAGLNPAAMFGSGSAAGTPAVAAPSVGAASVGTPSAPMPQTQSPFAGLGDAVGKAVNTAIASKTFDKMTQEISNMRADAALRQAQTYTEMQKPGLVDAQKLATDVSRRIDEAKMPAATLEGTTARDVLSLPTWLRETVNDLNFVGQKLGGAMTPIVSGAKMITDFGGF